MNQQLVEYNKEIQPLIRDLIKQKELLKDFVESDEQCIEHASYVKDAQEVLKSIIEESEDGKEILQKIKDIDNDIKQAVKGAARGTPYKAAELKAYFMARAKQSVEKVVDKGDLFETLEKELT